MIPPNATPPLDTHCFGQVSLITCAMSQNADIHDPPRKHRITLIPRYAVGPEVARAMGSVLRAAGVSIQWESFVVGAEALSKYGDPLPRDLIDSIRKNKVALKGPVMTPIGTGFVSSNVRLRKELDLYANL